MNFDNVFGFDWDEGNWPKCGKHGVSRAEIEDVFLNSPAIHTHPDYSIIEQRLRVIGKNNEGRGIYISFTIRQKGGGDYIRPISARYMLKKEMKRFEG